MVATIKEVLVAIAMSELNRKNHIFFMPVGKKFTNTLTRVRSKKLVEPDGKDGYKLTVKGVNRLKKYNEKYSMVNQDKAIDDFIDSL